MTLGWKDFSVTRTDGGADVFRLTGLLRDDDLISHDGSVGRIDPRALREHIANKMVSQALPTQQSALTNEILRAVSCVACKGTRCTAIHHRPKVVAAAEFQPSLM